MNYQNSSKSVAAKTPRKSRFTDVRKSLTAIIAIVIMLDPRFSRRSRSDLPLGSAATEHLCHLQLVDVVRHHFCRQCQIVHLFEAESKGLQTPCQQNHPEMRLSEDAETPSIPLFSNVNHSVPRNCNFEHPPIFREYQINKVHCRWFPLLKLFCAVIAVPCQFLICSAGEPQFLGGLHYSNPTTRA